MFSPETFDSAIEPLRLRFPVAFNAEGKKPAVLGVGALTHDTSAALVCAATGDVLYASPEERLSNTKHDSRFPIGTILRCCEEAVAKGYYIEKVAVNFDPALYLPGVIADDLATAGVASDRMDAFIAGLRSVAERGSPLDVSSPEGCRTEVAALIRDLQFPDESGRRQIALRLTWYLNVAIKYRRLAQLIEALFNGVPVRFVPHHDAHAASAYFGSGFDRAAVLVIDGHGEFDTTTLYTGDKCQLTRTAQTAWPFSLGSIFLATTRYLGFDYGDEYKVMGMSAYGSPKFLDEFKEAVSVSSDGRIEIRDSVCFGIRPVHGTGQIRVAFLDAFKLRCAPRKSGDPINQDHFDVAASVQALVEETGVQLARVACSLAGTTRLAVAGGVGLNGLMNEAIHRSGAVTDLFIYPAASDDGTSAGAAQALLLESGVVPARRMQSCYYGGNPTPEQYASALASAGVRYTVPSSINRQIAEAVAAGNIVARYTGGSEFGPRALGHRSILANPARADMKDVLNIRVKHREQFRPFAPACLRERVSEYFDIVGDAPFMILIVRARESAKALIPAVVHNDGTARVQTVSAEHNPDFHKTISEFHQLTGIPVMINTSFNVNGEAIVETPMDAIESFAFMDIDYLALGDYWISKADNPNLINVASHDEYLAIRKNRYAREVAEPLASLDVRKYQPWFYPDQDSVDALVASV
jgi:carbamoyltransferase